jgi:hypothetical protein
MATVESNTDRRTDRRTTRLHPGTPIEVQNRFTGSWCRGFEITEAVAEPACTHYRIRRTSDGTVLPHLFRQDDVRPR